MRANRIETLVAALAFAGITTPSCNPPLFQAQERTPLAGTSIPRVTPEPTIRPTPTPTENQRIASLVNNSTKKGIAFDESGQIREKEEIYRKAREHLEQEIQLARPDAGLSFLAEYDLLANATEHIIAASLVEGILRNRLGDTIFDHVPVAGMPNRALSLYLRDIPNLSEIISLDIVDTAPVIDLPTLYSLYQTLAMLQRHGKPIPRKASITEHQGVAEYNQNDREIIFSANRLAVEVNRTPSPLIPDRYSWARALGAFYAQEDPQFLNDYQQALNITLTRVASRLTQPGMALIVDRPLSANNVEDFEASVGYYLNEGYEFRRTINYLRFRGYQAEADVWQTRYDALKRRFGFEISAHGREYQPVEPRDGQYYQIADFLPELGDTIVGRKDPIPNFDTINFVIYGPPFRLKDGDLVQVVGPISYYADDVDRLLYPFVPVVKAERREDGLLVSDPHTFQYTGYLRGIEWLVPVS